MVQDILPWRTGPTAIVDNFCEQVQVHPFIEHSEEALKAHVDATLVCRGLRDRTQVDVRDLGWEHLGTRVK